MATGILLLLAGIWLVARTVTQDDDGNNLVDHIIGKAKPADSSGTIPAPGPTDNPADITGSSVPPLSATPPGPGAPSGKRRRSQPYATSRGGYGAVP